MILIKENIQKQRKVFKQDDKYFKIWGNIKPTWIINHVQILNQVCPNLVDDYGDDWISYNEVQGIPVSKLEHTPELVEKVYNFCLESLTETKPYVHGDWVASNIILKPDGNLALIDWDNIGIYDDVEILIKLHSDLTSSFGNKFYDSSSI